MIEANDLAASSPIDAWIQYASTGSLDSLVIIGDALVRRKEPLATLEELRAAVEAHAGRRGASALRSALREIRARTDSPRETILRLILTRSGLPEPLVNEPVTGHHGEELGLGDLVYVLERVVIEYEGEHHFADPDQVFKDTERIARFIEAGWRVIRVHKRHLAIPALIVARVRAALNSS